MRNFILGVLTGALCVTCLILAKSALQFSYVARASEPGSQADSQQARHGGVQIHDGAEFSDTYYSHPEEWVWPPEKAAEQVPADHWAYNALDYLRNKAGCLQQYRPDYFNGEQARTRVEFYEAIRFLYLYDLPRLKREQGVAAHQAHSGQPELDQLQVMEDSLGQEFSDMRQWDPLIGWRRRGLDGGDLYRRGY